MAIQRCSLRNYGESKSERKKETKLHHTKEFAIHRRAEAAINLPTSLTRKFTPNAPRWPSVHTGCPAIFASLPGHTLTLESSICHSMAMTMTWISLMKHQQRLTIALLLRLYLMAPFYIDGRICHGKSCLAFIRNHSASLPPETRRVDSSAGSRLAEFSREWEFRSATRRAIFPAHTV